MNISESKKSIELYGEKGLYASIAYVMCEAEGKNPLFVNHTGVENRYEYLRIAKVAVDFLISSGLLSLDKPGDLDEAQDIWQKLQILGFSGDDRKRFMSLIVNHATVFGPSGLDGLETWVKELMRGTVPSEEAIAAGAEEVCEALNHKNGGPECDIDWVMAERVLTSAAPIILEQIAEARSTLIIPVQAIKAAEEAFIESLAAEGIYTSAEWKPNLIAVIKAALPSLIEALAEEEEGRHE